MDNMGEINGWKTGLPLIMVKGVVKCLNSLKIEELKTFIPFLVQCSVERAHVQLVHNVPIWWQSPIYYCAPLRQPEGCNKKGFKFLLVSLVKKCYEYHDAEYILEFCTEFADPEDLIFQPNNDGTTSLFDTSDQKLLTFNNACSLYDKAKEPPRSPRHYRAGYGPFDDYKTTTPVPLHLFGTLQLGHTPKEPKKPIRI